MRVPNIEQSLSEGTDLFVQVAQSGTWAPGAGDGTFLLTLNQTAGQTIYFSDRPGRTVGMVPTGRFLDGLGFTPAGPPNAALVAHLDGGEEVLIIELVDPIYDETAASITYTVRVLAGYQRSGLASLAARSVDAPSTASFGAASLFIDGCSPNDVECVADGGRGDVVHTYSGLPECFVTIGGNTAACAPCEGSTDGDGTRLLDYWSGKCDADVTACAGSCVARVYIGT